jgi:hypothetical protein
VLPLLIGGHFVVVGRGRGPFLLFGALGFALGGVGLLFRCGGNKGVDGEDDVYNVDGTSGTGC